MKIVKVYEYANCSTCKKALKFLLNQRYATDRVDIVKTPPSLDELKQMLAIQGNIKKLFNTAGHLYQEMNLKDKLPKLSEDEALKLLSQNGKLVKRPFVLFEGKGVVGFDPAEWKKVFA